MSSKTRTILIFLHFAALLMVLSGIALRRYPFILIGAAAYVVPWILSLNSVLKRRDLSGLWVLFILFFGALGVPLYLAMTFKDEEA